MNAIINLKEYSKYVILYRSAPLLKPVHQNTVLPVKRIFQKRKTGLSLTTSLPPEKHTHPPTVQTKREPPIWRSCTNGGGTSGLQLFPDDHCKQHRVQAATQGKVVTISCKLAPGRGHEKLRRKQGDGRIETVTKIQPCGIFSTKKPDMCLHTHQPSRSPTQSTQFHLLGTQ